MKLRHLGVQIDAYDLYEGGEVPPAAQGRFGEACRRGERAVLHTFPAGSLLTRWQRKFFPC
jgi:hypothetical protein